MYSLEPRVCGLRAWGPRAPGAPESKPPILELGTHVLASDSKAGPQNVGAQSLGPQSAWGPREPATDFGAVR